MNMKIRRFLLAFLMGLAVLPAGAGAADPFEGTWELDLARSSFSAGRSGFKSQTRVMTRVPDGIQITVDAAMANGSSFTGGGTWRADGRDYPMKGIPGLDSIAMTQIGEKVQSGVAKLQGKPVMYITFSISTDGLTHLLHARTVEGAAQPFDNMLVFNRK